MPKISFLFFLSCCVAVALNGQPRQLEDKIEFSYEGPARSVSLAGDFNSWLPVTKLQRGDGGIWKTQIKLDPGIYTYKFQIDGKEWILDAKNPATKENFNKSSRNSVFVILENGSVLLTSEIPISDRINDEYLVTGKTLFLNIIWHQHQPLYLNPATDRLEGPWVRTHATKSYFDMTAMLLRYPNIHVNVNLTSSLLYQLQEYYVNRLAPFYLPGKNRIDANSYFERFRGKTDPWIDLMLKPTRLFDANDIRHLLLNNWNAFGISEVIIERFPEYLRLKEKLLVEKAAPHDFSEQELREIKFWFYFAWFDPDFMHGKVDLQNGSFVDLSDIIKKGSDDKYRLAVRVTEDLCNRMIAETYKVMAAVIPLHARMMYNPGTHEGQVEVATTPFYHPILPLIYDTESARIAQPNDRLPSRFSFPQDATDQINKAVRFYEGLFGGKPLGMWPAEGSVSQEIIPLVRETGIVWIATDEKVLYRSIPQDQPKYYPYAAISGDHLNRDTIVIVFRDTELSDKIGFTYQNFRGEAAADDFIRHILRYVPRENEQDRLLTVILDGENAWEWYRYDHDAKEFLNALYRKLSRLYESRQVVTVTTSEYIHGNPKRGVSPHPISTLPIIEKLHPGSWINANYDTWIGEEEENIAWQYLLTTRNDLAESGIPPYKTLKSSDVADRNAIAAWEAMFAAEGSDWFWWYGNDQNASGGDKPFDDAFRIHLVNVYTFARQAGFPMPEREFPAIIKDDTRVGRGVSQGVMAQSQTDRAVVLFQVDATNVQVQDAIYIVGNHELLGSWEPNTIRMRDDGKEGDKKAGDGIWSLRIVFPSSMGIQYKFTNSGSPGSWTTEEFPMEHRSILTVAGARELELLDIFGQND